MKKAATDNIEIISCGVFKLEIESLRKSGGLVLPVSYLPSRLHIYPDQLKKMLEQLINQKINSGKKVILIFGDCHSHMYDQAHQPFVTRVSGINCPDILLPKETFRTLRKQGAFFLLADWALNWQDIFQKELGLYGNTAKIFMQDMHSKLIYLDTGVVEPPRKHLEAMSHFSGLPWEIVTVSLQPLQAKINHALSTLQAEVPHE